MERASQLLLSILSVVKQDRLSRWPPTAAYAPSAPHVTLRVAARIGKMLGFELEEAEVERILTGLGLGVDCHRRGLAAARVPSWRFDISHRGGPAGGTCAGIRLQQPARVRLFIRADLVMPARPERQLPERGLRSHLSARGFREAITYSFVDPKVQQLFDPELSPVALNNPISADMAVMRTSLLPGLVAAVLRNTNRQQPRVRLFETGLRFVKGADGLQQIPTLAMVITGQRAPESWAEAGAAADFFDLKGDLESLLALTRAPAEFGFRAGSRAALHPGQTAMIARSVAGGEAAADIGYLGALHPRALKELGLNAPLYVCELDLEPVLTALLPQFTELSRFPEVRRDLAVVVDKAVPAAELMENVRAAAGAYLTDLRLFDVYEGKGIDPKRKSLALGLTFRDQSRTLSDEDVNKSVDQVIDLLEKNYKAELRN